MKKILCFLALLGSIVLSGCVMTTTQYQQVQMESGKVLVYIFRPESIISRGIHFEVEINKDQTLSPLVNKGYVFAHVMPGDINLVLYKKSFPRGKLDQITIKDAQAGQTYYVKANPAIFGAYKFEILAQEAGLQEISKTLYYDPK
ncbi:MAG: hypothetical protein KAI50_11035 [Desulfobacterales bacterium]|nr:hypothetical protein [Desulfobacterales bacterium]